MREWRKIRYWLDLYGCQVLQVKSSISLQVVSSFLWRIYQRRSHIFHLFHQVGIFCSPGLHFHADRRIPFSSGIIWDYKSKCWMWHPDTGQKFLSWCTFNIAYFPRMVLFFEKFCKTACSTGDIYIYVHFKTLCIVLSWISAFITPELSHHYYRGLFTHCCIYSVVAALDYKLYEMVLKSEYKPRPWLQTALNTGYLILWHAFAF